MLKIVLAFLFVTSALAEEVRILDDFEDGDMQSRGFGMWMPMDDRAQGGKTIAAVDIAVLEEAKVARLSYSMDAKAPTSGAYMALTMASPLSRYADLSGYRALRFRVRADNTDKLRFLLYSGVGEATTISRSQRAVSTNWEVVELSFDNLTLSDGSPATPELKAVSTLAIGSVDRPSGAGAIIFVDDVALVPGKTKFRPSTETIEREFKGIRFRCEEQGWVWDPERGSLVCPARSLNISFKAEAKGRKAAEVSSAFAKKMKILNMQDFKLTKIVEFDVGGSPAYIFGASGVPPAALAGLDPDTADGAHYEVLVCPMEDATYTIECRTPTAKIDDVLPVLRGILASIRAKE